MKNVIEITEKSDADKYRLLVAEALLKLYESDNGRPCDTAQELFDWIESANIERPIDPMEILTKDEIQAMLERLEG